MEVTTLEREAVQRPALKSAPPEKGPVREDYLREYAELAALVGVKPPELGVEEFKAFLLSNDITIFSLQEVITYMDAKAAKESEQKAGWEWRPLREKDNRKDMRFGTEAHQDWEEGGKTIRPGSDWYRGPHYTTYWNGRENQKSEHGASSAPYDKTVPLHALRKVALIEREYKGDVAFFVCDYAPKPEIRYPDPFLMAVVPNSGVRLGVGRFIIDFWDEPGFGIMQQIAP